MYAEIMSAEVSGETVDLASDDYKVKLTQKTSGWQNEFDFPKNLTEGKTAPADGGTVTFTWDSTNNKLSVDTKLTK